MKDRKGKQVLSRSEFQMGREGHKERVNEDEHSRSILHSCMKIEQ
jgi:hypothetical protein